MSIESDEKVEYLITIKRSNTDQFEYDDQLLNITTTTFWLLDEDHNPQSTQDPQEWMDYMEKADRIVRQTELYDPSCAQGVMVSTVFTGINQAAEGNGPPILFESHVFGGHYQNESQKCSTWNEAEQQHIDLCQRVFGAHPDQIEDPAGIPATG